MMIRKLSLVAAAAMLAVAVFGALAPHAAAQSQAQTTTMQVLVTPNDAPIKPLSGSSTLSGSLKYTYPGTGQAELAGTPVTLKVSQKPSWAVVTIVPSQIIIPVSGAETKQVVEKTEKFNVQISTTADAPAFTPETVTIQAVAQNNGNLNGATGETSFTVKADFFSIINARTDTPIQIARPQNTVVYPILVANFGNADTKIQFTVDNVAKGLTVVPPPPATLQSKQAGGKQIQDTLPVQVQTPYRNGYLNEVGSATVKIDSNYALDSKMKGDSNQLTILTTTKGFYVPGVSPLVFVGLLGAAALVTRQARRS